MIEAEGAGAKFQERLERARKAHGGKVLGEVQIVFRPRNFSLTNWIHVSWVIEQARGFDLVILDSLSALADADENEEMRPIAEALIRIKDESNAAPLALHHMTKEAWKPGQRPTLAQLRGPGVLAGRADAALAIVPMPEVGGVVRFSLWVMKQRDDQKAPPQEVEVLMTGDAATVTMKPLDEIATNAASHGARADLRKLVLEAIPFDGQGVTSKARLAAKLKRNETDVAGEVESLIDSGEVKRTGSWALSRPTSANSASGGSAEAADP